MYNTYVILSRIISRIITTICNFITIYLKAFEELDKDGAEYPRKITYHNPPNLSLEALEVTHVFLQFFF